MTDPNFIILYVDSPAISAQFYEDLLEKPAGNRGLTKVCHVRSCVRREVGSMVEA
jgi:hypothetical protein